MRITSALNAIGRAAWPRPARRRGKFVELHQLPAELLTASDKRSTAKNSACSLRLACSLQGIAAGGLHCPDFAQRRRALFSLAALLHLLK
jgi:hypothetical protein